MQISSINIAAIPSGMSLTTVRAMGARAFAALTSTAGISFVTAATVTAIAAIAIAYTIYRSRNQASENVTISHNAQPETSTPSEVITEEKPKPSVLWSPGKNQLTQLGATSERNGLRSLFDNV